MSGAEHRFIAALAGRLPAASRRLLGDDAALVEIGGAPVLVAVDVLVEGVDFRDGWGTPADVGWKAVAVNVSDIAAMGGRPESVVAGLVLGGRGQDWWEDVYRGVAEAAAEYGVSVAGGDVSRGPAAVLSVTVLGRPGDRIVWRAGARPGDLVCVSGPLGAAAVGLGSLERR